MADTKRALIVMAREPRAGSTKTRLTPPLSPRQAADLYRCLLLDTLDSVRTAAKTTPLSPIIAYAPQDAEPFFGELAPDFALLAQQGAGLGDRLAGAMLAASAQGYGHVAAINSDSPGLPPHFLVQAFQELDRPAVDLALGPSDDGGYYLIGWERPFARLINEVEMSTAQVLSDTLALARQVGARVALLPSWYDIDTEADLLRLRAAGDGGKYTKEFLAG